MKNIQVILVVLQIFILKIVVAPGQKVNEVTDAKSAYELLLTRFEIYLEYYTLREQTQLLYEEALQYGKNKEYEFGSILLEEALESLKNDQDPDPDLYDMNSISLNSGMISSEQVFNFSVMSGMDFNRQEFEVGFIESDSVVEEEFNKPYIGFGVRYYLQNGQYNSLELQNSVRFDKENLRDDYRIRWQPFSNFYTMYSGFWNEARVAETYSYWDQVITSKLTWDLSSTLFISVFNTFNYKSYRSESLYLKDFYRNRMNVLGEWRSSLVGITSLEYRNEVNESLGLEDNDYVQHNIRLGVRNDAFDKFYHNFIIDVGKRNYVIQFEDSLIVNKNQPLGFEGLYEVAVADNFKLFVEDNFLYKVYEKKSSLEPDYYWNFLRPGFRWIFFNQFEFGAGYEWEFKEHIRNTLDSYDVNEQNYNSNGIFISLNYFSIGGMYLTTSVSYQWRRYPDSITNDLISIYSNRNIFSAMILVFMPITSHLTLNCFTTFDNDDDIDFDQQNNQSTIFTLELEYIF